MALSLSITALVLLMMSPNSSLLSVYLSMGMNSPSASLVTESLTALRGLVNELAIFSEMKIEIISITTPTMIMMVMLRTVSAITTSWSDTVYTVQPVEASVWYENMHF